MISRLGGRDTSSYIEVGSLRKAISIPYIGVSLSISKAVLASSYYSLSISSAIIYRKR